ncbi:MAG: DMT family transporter [Deltaproteobacteria bacterium]|nr:DMT family transporter [Deltaproteobacteria bacterium]
MSTYLGEICALIAPMCWSVAIILYRRSSAHADPGAMTLFKNGFAVVLLTLTLLAAGIPIPSDRSPGDWSRLIVSGILGLAIADTLLFEALRRVGAGRLAIVDTVYAPLVVFLSWMFLGEQLTPIFLVGGAAVVAGVTFANLEKPSAADIADRRAIGIGIAFGLAAIAGTAVGVVLARPVLQASNLIEVTWTRLTAGVLAQIAWLILNGRRGEILAAYRPAPVWRTLVPAAFVGTYLSLIFWLGGFKWAEASVAAVLNQMATVYIVVLAWFVLGEPISGRRVIGGIVAVAGAWLVVLS